MADKPDGWMPLYIADYRADTSRLTTEQHGAYLLILMDYWRNGPPPDDDEVLAQITLLPIARWRKHRPKLAQFFTIKNGVMRQKRADAEMIRAQAMNRQRSEAGKISAAKRWGKQDDNETGNDEDNGSGNAGNNGSVTTVITEQVTEGARKNAPSPSPSPSPIPAPEAPSPTPTQIQKSIARPARSPDGVKILTGLGVEEQHAKDWIAARKGSPLTPTVVESLVREAEKAGISVAAAVKVAAESSWRGFKASWVTERKGNGHETVAEHNKLAAAEFLARQEKTVEGDRLEKH